MDILEELRLYTFIFFENMIKENSFQNLIVGQQMKLWQMRLKYVFELGDLNIVEFQMLEIWGFAILLFEND